MYGIVKYVEKEIDEHYKDIDYFLDQALYEKASKEYHELIEKVGKDIGLKIDDVVCLMETLAKDASYNCGFAEGIKFAIHNKLQAN